MAQTYFSFYSTFEQPKISANLNVVMFINSTEICLYLIEAVRYKVFKYSCIIRKNFRQTNKQTKQCKTLFQNAN